MPRHATQSRKIQIKGIGAQAQLVSFLSAFIVVPRILV
jgi:hypothetical protein